MTAPKRPEPLMSVTDVATYLGRSVQIVRRMVGVELQAINLSSDDHPEWRFRKDAVDAYLASRTVDAKRVA